MIRSALIALGLSAVSLGAEAAGAPAPMPASQLVDVCGDAPVDPCAADAGVVAHHGEAAVAPDRASPKSGVALVEAVTNPQTPSLCPVAAPFENVTFAARTMNGSDPSAHFCP